LALHTRRALYRWGLKTSTRLPVPVVVVGNVVVGGAGKTPTVIGLVQHLQARGWTPGIVSRGHGREGSACHEVTPDSNSHDVGDEPQLIAQATSAPMVVGRQRVEAARWLLQQHPAVNVIVSDDGMQHWPLARDLTVVVFDERGVGNGWLLPAGMLREPWPSKPWGGGRLLVLRTQNSTATSLPALASPYPTFQALRGLRAHAVNAQGRQRPLTELAALSTVGALAGIAQPCRFFDMLTASGVTLQHKVALPDHAEAKALLDALQPRITWLCTEKDAVKLFPLVAQRTDLQVWAVPLVQTPEPAFFNAVDQALDGLSFPHGRQTP
jgi:tetraacyldisaccharide 4'-kinase